MELPQAYIPMDRRHALAQGQALPAQSSGTALFADIAGFTALTESLVRVLGPQRGAEELPSQLNRVYDALIAEVDRYGGAVIGFAGDAMTCWFADTPLLGAPPPAARRAAACALALHQAMLPFANLTIPDVGTISLTIKVGIASGAVRRFLVGDPTIQTLDVLAGTTIDRMAQAEHVARRGEVLIDQATAAQLVGAILPEWRTDPGSAEPFAVLQSLPAEDVTAPWPALPAFSISLSAWMLPPVFERLQAGMGAFLTELRPATLLFLSFGGIDYDNDSLAEQKLDSFMLWAQRILRSYDAYILQLMIGDKGSLIYAAFGAPIAHEDDAIRAVLAALELREPQFPYLLPVQIGVAQGRVRTGAYGGTTRRTYGVLGDDVNLAARLMQHAPPGQVLVSQKLRERTADRFAWEARAPISVKGKALPISTYRLIGVNHASTRLHEPRYALPMVGRQPELEFIGERLAAAQAGRGQIVAISAEAGMGKSRLVAEVVRHADREQVVVYSGECQSYGLHTPYLVWRRIWQRFFGLDPNAPASDQIAALQIALARIDPALLPRLPLLGVVLDLAIPDSDLTREFDARLRKESLEALLVSCLRQRAREHPLLIVLEDCHWLDALSHDLLAVLGRTIAQLPVLLLLAYRPLQLQRLTEPRVAQLPYFRELPLDSLLPDEVALLVRLKLAQFVGNQGSVPEELVAQIHERAQGNPFYVEELLNYLRDQGIDPRDPAALAQRELPASLHSLILSRVDRLSESQKSLLKIASVIGRLFRAAILWGIDAFFGQQAQVRRDLDDLSALDLTPLDSPEPELTYLFKHIVTQEVTYESLPFATRAVIHEQIGQYLEQNRTTQEQLVDLLAFHYDRSTNLAKRAEYLERAGLAAQAIFANPAAINYFERLLTITPAAAQGPTLLRLGEVLTVVGRWDEAYTQYMVALQLAQTNLDAGATAQAQLRLGDLLRKQGKFGEAERMIEQALATFTSLNDQVGIADGLNSAGTIALHTGHYALAQTRYSASAQLQRALGNQEMLGKVLSNLGILAFHQGDVVQAQQHFAASLEVRRTVGNPLWIANSLGNLGMLAIELGESAQARSYIEESLLLERATGDRHAIAISLNNLGKACCAEGRYDAARTLYHEALAINHDLGDRWALAYLLDDLGTLAAQTEQAATALRLVSAASMLREAINAPLSPPEQAQLDLALASARAALTEAEQALAITQGRTMRIEQAIEEALSV
jgi:class 3 adenylate cyclase/tetratricopeptide (TPR) repeat protein